jgi:hypothetical protein
MSLSTGRSKLMTSLKELKLRWDRVRTRWDDPVSRDFEKEFVAPLEGKVRSAVSAIEQMNEIVSKARRDCG